MDSGSVLPWASTGSLMQGLLRPALPCPARVPRSFNAFSPATDLLWTLVYDRLHLWGFSLFLLHSTCRLGPSVPCPLAFRGFSRDALQVIDLCPTRDAQGCQGCSVTGALYSHLLCCVHVVV